MKVFNTQELSNLYEVSNQYIRAKISQTLKYNFDNNVDKNYITIKGKDLYFRKKLQGKGYEFCEIPFNELLIIDKSSFNSIFMSEIEKENQVKDIKIDEEIKYLKLNSLQQKQVDLKEKLVTEYLKNCENINFKLDIPTFLKQFILNNTNEIKNTKLTVNKTNLMRWQKAYKENGLYGFIKKSGNKKGKSYKIPIWVNEFLESKFFNKRGNISAKNLYDLVNAKAFHNDYITLEEFKDTQKELGGIISYNRVKSIIRDLKETTKYQYLINPDRFKNSILPAFGDMREKALFANHYWEIDSTKLDAFAKDGTGESTWNLISISDIKTGMKVLTIAKTSNSNAIAELLYKAFKKLGIPENIVTDNGKDYLSNHITGLFKKLGINQVRTEPFAGEQKPFVERHFGTLQNSFTELLNGYKGHNVAQFKAIQSQISTADRISGNKPKNEVEFIFDIALKLDEWIDSVYSKKHNSSLGCSPYEAYLQDEEHINRFDVSKIAFAFGKNKEVKIGKKGIRFNNRIYNNMDGLLGNKVGLTCILSLDFIDEKQGYLFDETGNFIAMVCDEKISKDGALQARALYKHQVKAYEKEWRALRKTHKDDKDIDLIIEAHKEAYKDARPIESIGGDAITQNTGNIKHLTNIGEEIKKQIEKREIINSEPDFEIHEKALENIMNKKEEKEKNKPSISYDELILKKAIG
jgi:putative transposase